MTKASLPKYFVLDVDGVMTTGQFLYSADGKIYKVFGPDDNDALKLMSKVLDIHFVTGDTNGFEISKRRIYHDMGFDISLVSTLNRIEWINDHFNLDETIYMGDGIFDHYVMREVFYSISPGNADPTAKHYSDYVTKRSGGDRAVSEACAHIINRFFGGPEKFDPFESGIKFSGI